MTRHRLIMMARIREYFGLLYSKYMSVLQTQLVDALNQHGRDIQTVLKLGRDLQRDSPDGIDNR